MIKKSAFLVIILAAAVHSNAQFAKYSNDFLTVGIGARSLGMANASVANVKDVTAGYWNPAGLSRMETTWDVAAMHAEYFAGIAKYDYLGVAKQINDRDFIAGSMIRLGVDGIQNTTQIYDNDGNIDLDKISKFSVADYAMIFSYAGKSRKEGLFYGANTKLIYRNIGKFANAWGFGFDLGLQYQLNNWNFGATLKDATTTFNVWSFNDDALEIEVMDSTFNKSPDDNLELTSPALILGSSKYFSLKNDFGILAEINAAITTDKRRHTLFSGDLFSIDPVLGLEFNYLQLAYLRMGIGNIREVSDFDGNVYTFQPNLGVGIHFKNIRIDYALTDIGDQSAALYSNVFSLRYSFDLEK